MRVAQGAAHLTYCTNIHPGETLAQVRSALETHVLAVKRAVCPDEAFGVGLRLSATAQRQLREPGACAELRAFLDAHELYVFTINGFPHGEFHATRVKERVYEPDWRSDARLHYSNGLADVLAALLPDGLEGSISTVPGAFAPAVRHADDIAAMQARLLRHAAYLHAAYERTGQVIALALEPEPHCFLETSADCVRFFEDHLLSNAAVARFAQLSGLADAQAQLALRRHLGVCLDTCHAAVEFEDPHVMLARLRDAGIGVKKLQLSAGLRVPQLNAQALAALAEFDDDVYLHQTVQQQGDALTRFLDLPQALAAAATSQSAASREWRVHFHVPLFLQRFGVLESTQALLLAVLREQRQHPISAHLEVETYTWDVLPAQLRSPDVSTDIARELHFVLEQLGARRS